MKSSLVILSAAFGLAAAVPRHDHHAHHAHHQEMKRDASSTESVDVFVAGPTVVMYSLNGNIISESDVLEGIKNGTLIWANGAPSLADPSSSIVSSTSSPVAAASTTFLTSASSSSSASFSSTSVAAASTSVSSAQESATPSASSSSSSGIDSSFPDGEIDCSDFPSDYGALALSYLGLGGWTGIQSPGFGSSRLGMTNIETVTSSKCGGSNCCAEGSYCSYACPAGYQKAHWPTTQGLTGQSVGGLLCKNGKLYKTNPNYDTLCITGSSEVTVLVRNEMSSSAAVCRTDYPGTESETVPVTANPGSVANLTCPDATYYEWTGKTTSAQYYVNPAGVSAEDGCQWGSSANPWGNYAPLNLGVGYSNGAAWLAIFQNAPTTDEKLDFTITIEGDNMNGHCRYSNGQYCSGQNYDSCSSTTGCTVSVSSGTAYFVFSN
ncbi:SUN-domain-containing protein [Aureobasidium subglaciale]|nr:SUN-domain-containing protein [Aureobasidium subglaciale]